MQQGQGNPDESQTCSFTTFHRRILSCSGRAASWPDWPAPCVMSTATCVHGHAKHTNRNNQQILVYIGNNGATLTRTHQRMAATLQHCSTITWAMHSPSARIVTQWQLYYNILTRLLCKCCTKALSVMIASENDSPALLSTIALDFVPAASH